MPWYIYCPECDREYSKKKRRMAIRFAERHNEVNGHGAEVLE